MEKLRNMKRGCISNIKKFKWEIVKIFEVVDSCFMPVFVYAWVFRCGCVSVCVCMCVIVDKCYLSIKSALLYYEYSIFLNQVVLQSNQF